MPRVWLHTNRSEDGFSVVEVLMAAVLSGMIVMAIFNAFVYGRVATATGGENARATALAEEGIDAVRNMRDVSMSTVTDGTYGLAQSGNVWVLSGASDTTNGLTRTVTISSIDSYRKNVTVSVGENSDTLDTNVTLRTIITDWRGALPKTWAAGALAGSYNTNSTFDGLKVATQGNYAYIITNTTTQNFYIINISNPSSPTLVSSLSLNSTPTNIKVSGNYAYVTTTNDNGELMVINVTTPASPSVASTYNAPGTADGKDVYISGNYAYMVRAANASNDELVRLNITTPTSITLASAYSSNVTMNSVYVYGSDIYVATSTGTAELLKLTVQSSGSITLTSSLNLGGTTAALAIAGSGTSLVVGQGAVLYTVEGQTLTQTGSITLATTINDVDIDPTNKLAFVGMANGTTEMQVINIATPATPTSIRTIDISGTASSLNGVAYNATLDMVVGASASDTQELVTFTKN